MKNRKLIATLMCAALAATAFSACGKEEQETNENTTPTAAPTENPSTGNEATPVPDKGDVQAEEIPEPVYYFSFDQADGAKGIQPTGQDKTGDPILFPMDKELTYLKGVKGDAVYIDGTYGLKLDVNGVGDTYTVSFWTYATRFADYMPTVQYGPDVHGDATGNQHYLNVTRASWGGDPAYPCIWSYDQASDAYWPNWTPEELDERMKQWLNITLVVDASKTTVDGVGLLADMYLNGELFGTEIPVARGTMAPSDNFDFLLGVNYWDAIFKGGFDELYIFDQALTAGQALALYQKGDGTVAFDEPEHIFVVKPNEKAIATIGDTSFTNALGSAYFEPVEIKDGQSFEIKLANWSDGLDTKDNYAMVFTADKTEDPLANAVATVYADADGDGTFNYTWGNWKTWSGKVMKDADVTIKLTRNGDVLEIQADNVDYNESANTMYATVNVEGAGESLYLYITAQKAYVELLSVKDKTPKSTTGTIVGNTDCTTPFWSAFSDIWAVPEGTSKTVHFTNYTDGVNNWDNFLVALQTTPTGHGADQAEGYAEYAVLRADNFGWGDGYASAVATCDWNWDTFAADMDGAQVALTVTNNGATADVVAVVTTTAGTVYTQSYKGITTGGELYFCTLVENGYLVFGPSVVGNTDCTTPFWSAFSDINTVAEGESKTVRFTNYTDGVNNWDNFLVVLQTTPTGHAADQAEGYAEYAVLRADNFGWGDGYASATATCDWNWDTFAADMDGASVAVTVTNNGATADVVAYVTTADGKNYRQAYEGITTNGPLSFCMTVENGYLVFEDAVVGNTDCVTPFWSAFSDIIKVAEGSSASVEFTNYTDGVNNWDNFLVILQTTPTGHAADQAEGYAEYAVLRADNFGWGDGYASAVATCDWNWDTFAADMDGANVVVTVTNNGATANVTAVATTAAGTKYTQSYEGITTGGELYFCLTVENGYLLVK